MPCTVYTSWTMVTLPFVCTGLLIIFHVHSFLHLILYEDCLCTASLWTCPWACSRLTGCLSAFLASCMLGLHFSFLCRGICCFFCGGDHVFLILGFLSYFSYAYPPLAFSEKMWRRLTMSLRSSLFYFDIGSFSGFRNLGWKSFSSRILKLMSMYSSF